MFAYSSNCRYLATTAYLANFKFFLFCFYVCSRNVYTFMRSIYFDCNLILVCFYASRCFNESSEFCKHKIDFFFSTENELNNLKLYNSIGIVVPFKLNSQHCLYSVLRLSAGVHHIQVNRERVLKIVFNCIFGWLFGAFVCSFVFSFQCNFFRL